VKLQSNSCCFLLQDALIMCDFICNSYVEVVFLSGSVVSDDAHVSTPLNSELDMQADKHTIHSLPRA